MNPAQCIIDRFGGIKSMAEKLTDTSGKRVPITTIQYWSDTGRIPSLRQEEVLKAAKLHGVNVEPADFFTDTDDSPTAADPQGVE